MSVRPDDVIESTSTIETAETAAASAATTSATDIQQREQYESHRLAWIEDKEHGIRVPVTEISQLDSPDGSPNPPLQVYRTMGPGSVAEEGLAPWRGFSRVEGAPARSFACKARAPRNADALCAAGDHYP